MKRFVQLTLLVSLVLGAVPVFALEISEGVVTTGISDRAPVDQVTTQSHDVGQLYCFTHVVGAPADSSITHVWYWGDKEMARVELPVRSNNWRTWSSKRLLPEWTGAWHVDVLDAEGNKLTTISFTID
jgi:Protein of unknown function (DUF2914)